MQRLGIKRWSKFLSADPLVSHGGGRAPSPFNVSTDGKASLPAVLLSSGARDGPIPAIHDLTKKCWPFLKAFDFLGKSHWQKVFLFVTIGWSDWTPPYWSRPPLLQKCGVSLVWTIQARERYFGPRSDRTIPCIELKPTLYLKVYRFEEGLARVGCRNMFEEQFSVFSESGFSQRLCFPSPDDHLLSDTPPGVNKYSEKLRLLVSKLILSQEPLGENVWISY